MQNDANLIGFDRVQLWNYGSHTQSQLDCNNK